MRSYKKTFRHRCSKCGKRYSWQIDVSGNKKHNKICKKCGSRRFYLDRNYKLCFCDAYWFPHQKGKYYDKP